MYIHFLSNYDDEKLIYRRNLAEIICFYLYLYNNRNHIIFYDICTEVHFQNSIAKC